MKFSAEWSDTPERKMRDTGVIYLIILISKSSYRSLPQPLTSKSKIDTNKNDRDFFFNPMYLE